MENKHQVHNLIILDESGSMESIKTPTINGFNELVQTLQHVEKEFPEQEHFISMLTFNSNGNRLLHFLDPVSQLKAIDASTYQPNFSTPLFDAIGFGVQKLKQAISGIPEKNVLVTILTDGEENASREFNGQAIKSLVEGLKAEGWVFTYIGTDHDISKVADQLSITNTMAFQKTDEGIIAMFEKEKAYRGKFSEQIRDKKVSDEGFYEED